MNTIALLFVLLVSCTEKGVSFDTLENARKQASENANLNAQEYRSKNQEYNAYKIGSSSDSSQTANCPQGDGWASLDLKNIEENVYVKLKCSTVSNAIGCLFDSEFKTKQYAKEDGICNKDLPFPLPKIGK